MQYKTYSQIKSKVERELDIEVEEFIQPEEFLGYVNDGIDECEAMIHKLGLEDEYFLTNAPLTLVDQQADYALPTNIYADKIRSIIYANGSTIYPIKRMRGKLKFENIALINQNNSSTDLYNFILRNDSAAAGKILQLVPKSHESISGAVTIWYIRNANEMTGDTSICDLPEIALQVLYQYVKYRCYEKEGHVNQDSAKAELENLKAFMMQTLEQQVPDDETEIEKDLSSYMEMS